MSRRPPSGGLEPPTSAHLPDGALLELSPLAEEVARRYLQEFPDEEDRYGNAVWAWCVHDNLHLLHWAVLGLSGDADLKREVSWLARVLEAREYPLDRLARDLDLAADVVLDHVSAPTGERLASAMRGAGAHVRSRTTFLDPVTSSQAPGLP